MSFDDAKISMTFGGAAVTILVCHDVGGCVCDDTEGVSCYVNNQPEI